jgi:homoserine O-acetyltransferase
VSARELRFHRLRRFPLDCGTVLKDVRQAFHLDGELNEAGDNLVVVFHALTGSADAVGGWWSEVAGPRRAIDTNRYAVLSPNLLGSCYGTTGRTVAGRQRPPVTPRDQARLVGLLVVCPA